MRIVDYIRDTRAEIKHVNWPTKQQVIVYTLAVILISVILAVVLGAFDTLFSFAIKYIIAR